MTRKPSLLTKLIDFTVWSLSLAELPAPTDIQTRYGVSRATSYRWLDALTRACLQGNARRTLGATHSRRPGIARPS